MKNSIKGYKRYLFFALAVVFLAVVAINSVEVTEGGQLVAAVPFVK